MTVESSITVTVGSIAEAALVTLVRRVVGGANAVLWTELLVVAVVGEYVKS